jgi:N-methylhydantoinase A
VSPSRAARLGVDIGGTFTDIVLLDPEGLVWSAKVSTSPDDYARAIAEGARRLAAEAGLAPDAVGELVHGTTVATNAILERSGPPVGLLTTRGFRDVLEIGRIRTPTLYDLSWDKPKPLVPRRHRLEVDERVMASGEVLQPLALDSVRGAVEQLVAAGVRALAVCLINAYVNPVHEQQIARLLAREYPQLPVSISSEILPEIKEYERTSTTVINAYLQPVVSGYLRAMQARLAEIGLDASLQVMQSNGGTMSAAKAAELPIYIVASGPAAGVIAAQRLAEATATPDLIAFDMGGTTAKASPIEGGRITRTTEYEVRAGISTPSRFIKAGGYLIMVPAIDIAEVGNGAGSIARVDRGGALRVGPESAGAWPGPACYGLGGREPTITDANVLLGYLDQEALVGGELPIDRDLAERAVAERIAGPLSLSVVEAAYGIHAVANSNMMRPLRAVTIERGRDPRGFALCAYGGSGPVHAAELAAEIGIARVIVPPLAGVFSAFGLLSSQVEHHYSQTRLRPLATLEAAWLADEFAALERQARATMRTEGYADGEVALERLADLRYVGQSGTLSVVVELGGSDEALRERLGTFFGEEHRRTYGHRSEEEPIELVSLRLIAHAASTQPPAGPARFASRPSRELAPRRAYFGPRYGFLETLVLAREDLATPLDGPLIVEEYDATTVVPPNARARLDEYGNIVMELASSP